MRLVYSFETRVGIFYIGRSKDGRWHPIFEDESLGSYHSAAAALDDLVGGHTFSLPRGIDSSKVGLPNELAEWDRVGHA